MLQKGTLIMGKQGRQSVPKSGRSERGGERNFGIAPRNVLLKGYFCPNFRGGAEKVVVHMHWLTWVLWRPWSLWIYYSQSSLGLFILVSLYSTRVCVKNR